MMCEDLEKVVIDTNTEKYFQIGVQFPPKKETNCWLSLGRTLMFFLEVHIKP